jgi:hypothetical protein
METATRRDLAQLAWAVLVIDTIAFGLGALAARYVGGGAYWIGVALAAFVTIAFGLVVAMNLAAVWLARVWIRRNR